MKQNAVNWKCRAEFLLAPVQTFREDLGRRSDDKYSNREVQPSHARDPTGAHRRGYPYSFPFTSIRRTAVPPLISSRADARIVPTLELSNALGRYVLYVC